MPTTIYTVRTSYDAHHCNHLGSNNDHHHVLEFTFDFTVVEKENFDTGGSVSVSIFCLDIMTLMMLFSLARLGLLYLQELNGVNRVIVQKLYITESCIQ